MKYLKPIQTNGALKNYLVLSDCSVRESISEAKIQKSLFIILVNGKKVTFNSFASKNSKNSILTFLPKGATNI